MIDRNHSQRGYCTACPETSVDTLGFVEPSETKLVQTRDDCVRVSRAVRSELSRSLSLPELNWLPSCFKPGSSETREFFFVRQEALNLNASFGTPVREVCYCPDSFQSLVLLVTLLPAARLANFGSLCRRLGTS